MQTAPWQERTLFVSSTFRDFHAERDWLRDHVLPHLQERLRQAGLRCHFEAIDFRWGVDTQSVQTGADQLEREKQIKVLRVCLGEVERSRPFFLALLGGRYGWVAPADRMRQAAQQHGLVLPDEELVRTSVTALEVQFGILLAGPDARRRCRVYLRAPLPYDELVASGAMAAEVAATYSDDFAARRAAAEARHEDARRAADAAERQERLKRLLAEALPGRVEEYQATWDPAAGCLTGLRAWGQRVCDQLFEDIYQELAGQAAPDSSPFDEFLARNSRLFLGREALIERLVGFATAGPGEGGPAGLCLTGEPGAGKSSLFARLHAALSADARVLLLAHAAGADPSSASVDSLLRGWTERLAEAEGVPSPLTPTTPLEQTERAFAGLLAHAAGRRPVVLLLDALDQFEATPRGRHLTWLPRPLPQGARLIATTIPGAPADALARRPDCAVEPLKPLETAEAAAIAEAVCRRYRRELNPAVRDRLLARARPDGAPAAGNPLWLVLAVEELNLLDLADFTAYEGLSAARLSPAQRDNLRALATNAAPDELGPEAGLYLLLLDTVSELPPDVEGLYDYLLGRAERVVGPGLVRAFACLLATGRRGWRELDLRVLLPAWGGAPWDDLAFAELRRAFRGHLAPRGALVQWEFAHAQMRPAVLRRYLPTPEQRQQAHAQAADFLLSLPADDPARASETMYHLLHAGAPERAGRALAGEKAGDPAEACRSVAAFLDEEPAPGARPPLAFIVDMMEAPGLNQVERAVLCARLAFDVGDLLLVSGEAEARVAFLEAVSASLRKQYEAARRDPAPPPGVFGFRPLYGSGRDLRGVLHRLGTMYERMGRLDRAEERFLAAVEVTEALLAREADTGYLSRDQAKNHSALGSLYLAQGRDAAAWKHLKAQRQALHRLLGGPRRQPGAGADAMERLMADVNSARLPSQVISDLVDCNRELARLAENTEGVEAAVGYANEAVALAQRLLQGQPDAEGALSSLAGALQSLGDASRRTGQTEAALACYRMGVEHMRRVARARPDDEDVARSLAVLLGRHGDELQRRGDLDAAMTCFRENILLVRELCRRNPRVLQLSCDLVLVLVRLGDAHRARRELEPARAAYAEALPLAEALHRAAPTATDYAQLAGGVHQRLGGLDLGVGDHARAMGHMTRMHALNRDVFARAPDNLLFRRGLASALTSVAAAAREAGDEATARAHYGEALGHFAELLRRDANNPQDARAAMQVAAALTADMAPEEARAALAPFADGLGRLVSPPSAPPAPPARGPISVEEARRQARAHLGANRPAEALALLERALPEAERRHQEAPEGPASVRLLADCLEDLADACYALGEWSRAREAFERYVVCARWLLARERLPRLLRNLAVVFGQLASCYEREDNAARAGGAHAASVRLFEDLGREEGLNAESAMDLAIAYHNHGLFLLHQGEQEEASGPLGRFVALARRLREAGVPLPPGVERSFQRLDGRL